VTALCADGSTKTPTLFQVKEGLSADAPVGFTLKDAKALEGDAVWLRYLLKKADVKRSEKYGTTNGRQRRLGGICTQIRASE